MKKILLTIPLILLCGFIYSQNYAFQFFSQYSRMKPKHQKIVNKYVNYYLCQYSKRNYNVYKPPFKNSNYDNGYSEIRDNLIKIKKKYKLKNSFLLDYLLALNVVYKGKLNDHEPVQFDKKTRFKNKQEMFDFLEKKYDLIQNYTNMDYDYESDFRPLGSGRIYRIVLGYYLNRVQLDFIKRGNFELIEKGFDFNRLKDNRKMISRIYSKCKCNLDNEQWSNNVTKQFKDKRISMEGELHKNVKTILKETKSDVIIINELNESEIEEKVKYVFELDEMKLYRRAFEYFKIGETPKVSIRKEMSILVFESKKDILKSRLDLESLPLYNANSIGYWINLYNLIKFIVKPENCNFVEEKYAGDMEVTTSFTRKTTMHHYYYDYDCSCDYKKLLLTQNIISNYSDLPIEPFPDSELKEPNKLLAIFEVRGKSRLMDWAKKLGELLSEDQIAKSVNKDYTIIVDDGDHSITKDNDGSIFHVSIYDGGILSSNVDDDSYLVTYKCRSETKVSKNPFEDSLYDVGGFVNAKEIEVSIRYKKQKKGETKMFKVLLNTPGGYTININ